MWYILIALELSAFQVKVKNSFLIKILLKMFLENKPMIWLCVDNFGPIKNWSC